MYVTDNWNCFFYFLFIKNNWKVHAFSLSDNWKCLSCNYLKDKQLKAHKPNNCFWVWEKEKKSKESRRWTLPLLAAFSPRCTRHWRSVDLSWFPSLLYWNTSVRFYEIVLRKSEAFASFAVPNRNIPLLIPWRFGV